MCFHRCFCANYDGPCDADSVTNGAKIVAGIGINDGTLTQTQAGSMATALAAYAVNAGADGTLNTADDGAAASATDIAIAQLRLIHKNKPLIRFQELMVFIRNFHNQTNPFNLNARAIFTEFYFDVANNHKLTLGLRYTQDRKDLQARALLRLTASFCMGYNKCSIMVMESLMLRMTLMVMVLLLLPIFQQLIVLLEEMALWKSLQTVRFLLIVQLV